MEELFAVVIVVIGVIVKLVEAFNNRRQAAEQDTAGEDNAVEWEDVFGFPLEDRPSEKPVPIQILRPQPSEPVQENHPQYAANAATLEDVNARILEEQRKYAEMAIRAEAANQASMAGECSCIYVENDHCENENNNSYTPSDWAELIRNNRCEALVMSEILAPPLAMRK